MVKSSFWMLVAAFFFTVVAALAKVASADYGVWEVVFWRSIVGVLFCAMLLKRHGITPKTTCPVRHFVRCAIGTTSIALGVYILSVMPIALAQTLNYTGPLWFCLFLAVAARFTGARLDPVVLLAVFLGFAGVLCILRPDLSIGLTTLDVTAGIIAGLTSGGADFMIRHLSQRKEPPERIVFYFTLAGTVTGFCVTLFEGWHPLTLTGFAVLLGIGIAATLAQITLTHAWTYGHPLVNAVFSFAGIPFAVLFGVAFFAESLDTLSLLGMLTVAAAGTFASWRRLTVEGKSLRQPQNMPKNEGRAS